jgi:uncharacterized repeat protein (TIGR03803 family)
MKSMPLIAMCVLLAGQFALAQSAASSATKGEQASTEVSHQVITTRAQRNVHSGRQFAKEDVQTGPEQVLYTFLGTDGMYPSGNLTFDASGNLYGTARLGGSGNCSGEPPGCGTVFELSPDGSGGWTGTVLYNLQGGSSDGLYPTAGVIFDAVGNLYGTTLGGGSGCSGNDGCGTVFELSRNGSGSWTETVLYSFQNNSDGSQPAGLIIDGNGNLYGTTSAVPGNEGTVFELKPQAGGTWVEQTLYSFKGGSDGQSPNPALIFDGSGNLYGTAADGGACNACGTVFELSPNGSGGWTKTTLYEFQPSNDGSMPNGGLIFDASGDLYGTASGPQGTLCTGDQTPYSCGIVFELTPNGSGGWTESIPFAFLLDGSQGAYPETGLTLDQSGNLYGTTEFGPEDTCTFNVVKGCGVVFELSKSAGGPFTETVLYAFQDDGDGAFPSSGVILDHAGNLYGTTQHSVNCQANWPCGEVYEVSIGAFTQFSPPTVNFGNQTLGIASNPTNVTLTNSGNQPLTISSLQITGGPEFSQQNNCPATLAQNANCAISITFTPAATGAQNATITVSDNASGSPQTVSLTGTGVLPSVNFSPASANFGNQTAGTNGLTIITLTNTGIGVLTVSSIGITGPNSGEFSQTNNCPTTLQPANSCGINVTFAPNVLGSASASLNITDNAPGSPQGVPLTGTGMNGIVFSPSTMTFPSQYVGTAGLPQTVTLTNNGNTAIAIMNVTASPSDFAPLSSCGNSLAPGAACSVGVFFDPTASGTRNGVLTVTDNAFDGPQAVPLTGTGEDFAMMAGSPSASVTPGEMAKYTIEVAPAGGFSQTVALTCTGAPVEASCSVSPSSVKLSGSKAVPVTITVATAGGSAGMAYPTGFGRGMRLATWLAFAGLPGVVLVGGRRRWIGILCVVLAIVMWTACGGGMGGTGGSGPSTPPGSYNLTVVGTFSQGSANLVHSTKITLIVQ